VKGQQSPGLSPAWIVNLQLAIATGVTILLLVAACAIPSLPFALRADGDRVVVASTGQEVGAIRVPGGPAFRLEPMDIVEEPDVVETWGELDRFYARQGELWDRLSGPVVEVEIAGVWQSLPVVGRTLRQLPGAFYTLLVATLVTWLVGFATYAFSDRGPAARMYAMSAVAFCVAVWPAALYMSRPLALDPEWFKMLATIDHIGGLFFAAGVINMLAVYPVDLGRSIKWSWGFALAAAVVDHFQVSEKAITGFYTANAIQFAIFLLFSFWQWRASRPDPLKRAAFGWIALSAFVGVIFFFTLITLPVLLGSPPVITQTTGFVSMVVMFAGISLGVLRFRLFDLDRWWFRTWSWIFSGVVVVSVDLLLTRLFHVQQSIALVSAVIVVGWVYFPVRQVLFERLVRARRRWAEHDTRRLIAARTPAELATAFRSALQQLFAPLEIVEADGHLDAPRLAADGAWLEVPSPFEGRVVRCHFRDDGARLYAREDLDRAAELAALGASTRLAMDAREEGQVAERTRIRRDLHDDLGASIIRIAHESNDDRTASLAKAAMRDLRDVLTALGDKPVSLCEALEDVEADLRERAQADERDIEWVVRGEVDRVLSSRAQANLTRALRESMTNALKHGAGTIHYELDLEVTGLRVAVTNAVRAEPEAEPGMGLANMAARMAELGGVASACRRGGAFILTLELPWSRDP
jgi:signal transduction histidine kinase